jgi:short chain dehydrogenase
VSVLFSAVAADTERRGVTVVVSLTAAARRHVNQGSEGSVERDTGGHMELDLAGRVMLVTGGSRGIGHAVARALVAEGACVAICSRDETTCLRAAGELGQEVEGFAADVGDDAAVHALVAHVAEHFGRPAGAASCPLAPARQRSPVGGQRVGYHG